MPRPVIPLWRMRPKLLGDLEYRRDIQETLAGYFGGNWTTAQSRGIEWKALKVVIQGKSLSKTYGIRKKLDQELAQQEDAWVFCSIKLTMVMLWRPKVKWCLVA
ncbi:hypothetical protein NDU88_002708 [Pleurodeles waltl]|uniref:Uncharacterized protein n=1 Tax=Pleurodeles waltl TaxID=8319 RepID=A0AAV7UZ98_PLEWA|nr:hypothetical protein NDU88_002708 [Pleurodeles waltl]